jgi:hypothetical protein
MSDFFDLIKRGDESEIMQLFKDKKIIQSEMKCPKVGCNGTTSRSTIKVKT